jgi:hypothetical protein
MFPSLLKNLKTAFSGTMWFLDKLYGFVIHRVTITLLLLTATGAGVYYSDFIKNNLNAWSVFSRVEALAVVVAFILSQFSYGSSVESIARQQNELAKQQGDNDRDEYRFRLALFSDQFFALVNLILFALAVCLISYPLWHILCIQAVLFAFSINNFFQRSLALELESKVGRHAAIIRAMDMHHWLFSENGPGVVGYLIVILLLSCFGHWRGSFLRQDQIARFPELLEAVAAGVAGYQISLSTAVYFFFHDFRTARALEFAGFASACDDRNLVKHIRKMGPSWFMIVVAVTFLGSVFIVIKRAYLPQF